jgi:hypothetical protein
MQEILAQREIDGRVAVPTCCDAHKQFGWWQIQAFFVDFTDDLEYGKIMAEETCLN